VVVERMLLQRHHHHHRRREKEGDARTGNYFLASRQCRERAEDAFHHHCD
jgi:hypothetical protein